MLQGVDISQWQANLDYAQVAQNIDFAMVRASYSTTIVDHLGWEHRTYLRERDVALGHYHYAEPAESPATAQARAFLDSVGWLFRGEPLALDVEVDHPALVDWCANFARILRNITGVAPFLYTNIDFLRRYDWRPLAELECPLWVASWQDPDSGLPSTAPWVTPRMHQFTDEGHVPGINGNVDQDRFFGSVDDFRSLGPIVGHG